ncbi:tyrosine-type recombinase/integrase [Shewanella oncorhynchi]|uniref:Tyrosine-type recombinase/integrase n=1 Tax=Shewanella oncorhynchi TaxID=2726434 RepID=A0AA50KH50_9GAMM|nr:tyrosine-type recombinase/integrase [Shewanella oncorhynchi]WMB74236.1 tyrosine-type recombinase/integrase [Shewanella oncorhynchi]
MSKTKHLTLRNGTYYLNYRVPKDLVSVLGKTNIMKSLKTDSLKEAVAQRDQFLATLHPEDKSSHTILKASRVYLTDMGEYLGNTSVRATNRAVKYLRSYMGCSPDLSEITRPVVSGFLKHLSTKLKPKSIRTLTSCLNRIWCHSYDKGYVHTASPFQGHTVAPRGFGVASKLPFTPEQWNLLTKELKRDKTRFLFVQIGLYTGMRINEIANLLTKDVYQDSEGVWMFNIRKGKTEASIRRVPIPDCILNRVLVLKETSMNEFLFEEVVTYPSNRSGNIALWFSRLKLRLISEDKRLCFHSLRVMFITAMEEAEINEGVAATIVGHRKHTMTYGLYSKGVSPSKLKNALECAVGALESTYRLQ